MSFDSAANPIQEETPDAVKPNRRLVILGALAGTIVVAVTGACVSGACSNPRSTPFPPSSTSLPSDLPSNVPSYQPSDVPSFSPSRALSQMPSDEPSLSPVRTALGAEEEGGCALTQCFLINLHTDVETPLTGDDTYQINPDTSPSYSIRCDVDEELAFFDFTYAGATLREWNAPFFMNGNSKEWVEPVVELSSCGDKSFSVSAFTSSDGSSCFDESFGLTADCGAAGARLLNPTL